MLEDELLRLARNSVTPWKSLDACGRKVKSQKGLGGDYILDGVEQMMECFNCKKAECDNCHDEQYSGKRAIRMKEAREIFLRYYHAGYGKERICEVMRISPTTYSRYKHNFLMGER